MRGKITAWMVSGLFIIAMMAGVLGISSVGSTSPKAKVAIAKASVIAKTGDYQTTRVFWPIWNGGR